MIEKMSLPGLLNQKKTVNSNNNDAYQHQP